MTKLKKKLVQKKIINKEILYIFFCIEITKEIFLDIFSTEKNIHKFWAQNILSKVNLFVFYKTTILGSINKI